MSIESTAAVMQRYWDGHDHDAVAEDAVFTDIASGQSWRGRAAIDGMLDFFYEQAFDARFESQQTYIADGLAAVEGRFIGVHKGEFAGVPGSGKQVDVPLAVFYSVAEHSITEGRVWFMLSSFLQQVSD